MKNFPMSIDGSIPEDNRFPGSPVWALGFRVPQGLVSGSNGNLYSAEHGNVINDEVNLMEKGGNYGYPNVSGACDKPKELEYCASHSIKAPIIAWTPTVAPPGLDYYDSSTIPEWQNSLLLVTLKTQSLRVLYLCVNSFPGSVRVDDFSGSGFMPGGVQIIRLVGERCVN